MKHNPEILVKLALDIGKNIDAYVIVVTEGLGEKYLRRKKAEHKIHNLVLLPFQQFESLPLVLAGADILLALLEPDAGVFAVPSKILTYLCAKRPLLLAVPSENLAARIVEEQRAGIVTPPSEPERFIEGARTLIHDRRLRNSMAANGRAYAKKTFDIEAISNRFEKIITG